MGRAAGGEAEAVEAAVALAEPELGEMTRQLSAHIADPEESECVMGATVLIAQPFRKREAAAASKMSCIPLDFPDHQNPPFTFA